MKSRSRYSSSIAATRFRLRRSYVLWFGLFGLLFVIWMCATRGKEFRLGTEWAVQAGGGLRIVRIYPPPAVVPPGLCGQAYIEHQRIIVDLGPELLVPMYATLWSPALLWRKKRLNTLLAETRRWDNFSRV